MSNEGAQIVIAEVMVSPDDRLAALEIARKRNPQRWTFAVFAGVLALVAILLQDWVLAALLAATALSADFYGTYAVRRNKAEPATAYRVRVTPVGITVTGSLTRNELQWAAITDVIEAPPLLVFEHRRQQLLVMPLRDLTREQVASIRQAHVTARATSRS